MPAPDIPIQMVLHKSGTMSNGHLVKQFTKSLNDGKSRIKFRIALRIHPPGELWHSSIAKIDDLQ